MLTSGTGSSVHILKNIGAQQCASKKRLSSRLSHPRLRPRRSAGVIVDCEGCWAAVIRAAGWPRIRKRSRFRIAVIMTVLMPLQVSSKKLGLMAVFACWCVRNDIGISGHMRLCQQICIIGSRDEIRRNSTNFEVRPRVAILYVSAFPSSGCTSALGSSPCVAMEHTTSRRSLADHRRQQAALQQAYTNQPTTRSMNEFVCR